MRALSIVLVLALAAVGCKGAHAEDEHASGGGHDAASATPSHGEHDAPPAAHGATPSAHEEAKAAPSAEGGAAHAPAAAAHGSGHGAAEGEPRKKGYVVPFTWDASEEEPLARMRGFMRSLLADNARYATEKKPDFFKAFANGQKPRATLVTCSDSRVQSPAFDATPENDVFTIRDIGNQILTAEGSVEYGVHHLKTPLLLVMGHSGCGAVKAAMGDYGRESPAIQRELSSLQIPKAGGATPEAALTAGVVANVHAQVSIALLKWGEEIESGELTVVGAVYDFRNDLGQGAGRVTVVNVNGQSEKERVDAFVRAMQLGETLNGAARAHAAEHGAGERNNERAKPAAH